MQPEVVKEFSIPITAGDVYVGLVRSVDKNPQIFYEWICLKHVMIEM